MTDELDLQDELVQQLRREYLAEAPARLDELRKDLAAARAREPEALASLRSRLHKLAGSGGSYGFPAITEAGRAGEHWILDHPDPDDEGFAWLGAVIGRIAAAFEDAARELGAAPASDRSDAFAWRAHVAGGSGELVSRIEDALREAHYAVSTGPLAPDAQDIPVTERPDLLVLAPSSQEDLRPVVQAWLRDAGARTVGIALVTERPPNELLETFPPGVDVVINAELVETELVRWARGIARAASTPLSALLILPEEAERTAVTEWLETEGILVTAVAGAEEGLEAILSEAPDLLLLDWDLPERSAAMLVRMLRSRAPTASIPVLALSTPDDDGSLRDMLAAGVDAPLTRPVTAERLMAEASLRGRRTRRLEALLRRDSLTGFLSRGAFEDDLEIVLAQTRRTGEQVSLIILDPDHFRRINEQLGRRTGDRILHHIAQTIRRRIRASDTAIRLGGEELGILLRQCGPAEALAIANQLRTAILERPPEVEGMPFPVRLSAGVASSGSMRIGSARDLVWEAEQALREAKETGRDRVVVASQ